MVGCAWSPNTAVTSSQAPLEFLQHVLRLLLDLLMSVFCRFFGPAELWEEHRSCYAKHFLILIVCFTIAKWFPCGSHGIFTEPTMPIKKHSQAQVLRIFEPAIQPPVRLLSGDWFLSNLAQIFTYYCRFCIVTEVASEGPVCAFQKPPLLELSEKV